jgi:hypothetical protein
VAGHAARENGLSNGVLYSASVIGWLMKLKLSYSGSASILAMKVAYESIFLLSANEMASAINRSGGGAAASAFVAETISIAAWRSLNHILGLCRYSQ